MSEQWIDAATALNLAGHHIALCARVYAGLVPARARLLVVGDKRAENALVPVKFWWATGHEALDQSWETGDFATWIDNREHWKAFGVTFALSGLLEMLQSERRPIVARSLSVAGSAEWMSAKAARRFVYERCGASPTSAGSTIVEQARLGFVLARAVRAEGVKSGPEVWSWEAREWDVEEWVWQGFVHSERSAFDWDLGRFTGRGNGPNGLRELTLSGLHFLSSSIEALSTTEPAVAKAVEAPRKSGGRPPAAFADDLMCAIWGQIYRGDLKPGLQADVKRAMLSWASDSGHELGDTVAGEKAGKIFKEYSA